MQGTYIQEGREIDYTPSAAVVAGQVVVQGPLVGIAKVAIAAGKLGALSVSGIFDVDQNAEIITAGASVYWDADGTSVSGTAGAGAATATASGNTFMGFAQALTAATDSYVRIALRSAETTAGGVATATSITGTASTLPIAGLQAAQGGTATVAGGVSTADANAGGAASLTGGRAGAEGVGGAATVAGGLGGTTSGTGGAAALAGGAAASAAGNAVGGAASVTGGIGKGNLAGGAVAVTGGVGGATGAGGLVAVAGGTGGATSGTGGVVSLTGGAAHGSATNAAGGAASIVGGAGKGTGVGGAVAVTGGAAAGSGAGGNVTLTPGTSGSGIAGGVIIRGDAFFAQDAATAESAGAQTIAAADFVNGIVVHTVTTGATLTTPTGAQIAAVLPAGVTTGDAFRFHVITVGTGSDDISTLTAGDGDVTFVGNVTVGPDAAGTCGYGTWIFRMTGATTFVGYRVG